MTLSLVEGESQPFVLCNTSPWVYNGDTYKALPLEDRIPEGKSIYDPVRNEFHTVHISHQHILQKQTIARILTHLARVALPRSNETPLSESALPCNFSPTTNLTSESFRSGMVAKYPFQQGETSIHLEGCVKGFGLSTYQGEIESFVLFSPYPSHPNFDFGWIKEHLARVLPAYSSLDPEACVNAVLVTPLETFMDIHALLRINLEHLNDKRKIKAARRLLNDTYVLAVLIENYAKTSREPSIT